MNRLIALIAMLAGSVSAGGVVIDTPNYRITAGDCTLSGMTWVEDGRQMGKASGQDCGTFAVQAGSFSSPFLGDHVVMGSIFDSIDTLWFECAVTGWSTEPDQIRLFCYDDPLFTKR